METIYNAKIKYSFLGVDEEGTPLMQIGFDCKNGSVFHTNKVAVLDTSFIKDILDTLEIRSWEELPRKFARIKVEEGKVIAVGHLIEDKWVIVK